MPIEAAQLTAQADSATTATHRTALRWWWLIRLFCRRLLHAHRSPCHTPHLAGVSEFSRQQSVQYADDVAVNILK